MEVPGGKFAMKILTIVLRIPVAMAVRKTIARIWAAARPDAEQVHPKDAGVRWSDALAWSALSAVGVAASQLITRKGAEETFRVLTGNEPPPPPPSRAQKKAAKKQAKHEAKQAKEHAKEQADSVATALPKGRAKHVVSA
jgi:hypothetical protein